MLQVGTSRDGRALLERPRVLEHLDRGLRHPVVLLGGLNGMGRVTALTQWAQVHGAVLVQPGAWDAQAAAQVVAAVATGQRTLLVLSARDPGLGEALEHARSLGGLDAYLHVVVRGGVALGVDSAALTRHSGVEVASVDPRLLLFTRSEIMELGRLHAREIDEIEAGEILDATSGHPELVVSCLRRDDERDARDQSWLEVAVGVVRENLTAQGPNTLLPTDLRAHLRRVALLGGVPTRVTNALAARQGWAEDLQDLVACGLVSIGPQDSFQIVEVLGRAVSASAPRWCGATPARPCAPHRNSGQWGRWRGHCTSWNNAGSVPT